MGDWVDVTFAVKPTLVDEAFLNKLDACFAEVGYHSALKGRGMNFAITWLSTVKPSFRHHQ